MVRLPPAVAVVLLPPELFFLLLPHAVAPNANTVTAPATANVRTRNEVPPSEELHGMWGQHMPTGDNRAMGLLSSLIRRPVGRGPGADV